MNDRYLVRGKRIDSEEIVTGWLVASGHNDVKDKQGRYLRTDY